MTIQFFFYLGIPYALPPIGELRFKRTKPILDKGWEGVFDGSGQVTVCFQPTGVSFWPYQGDEDCLQLNVYVPVTESKPKNGYPVMVWFHGGGFTSGDATTKVYGPGALLDQDVILVTVNYRLGILGFMTLGTDNENGIAGNQGMWDQYECNYEYQLTNIIHILTFTNLHSTEMGSKEYCSFWW
jgi:carboxylesterase type B